MPINNMTDASVGPLVALIAPSWSTVLKVFFHDLRVYFFSISSIAAHAWTHMSTCSVDVLTAGSAVGPKNHAIADVTQEFVPA